MPSNVHDAQVISDPAAGALPGQSTERVRMKLQLAVDLVLCGVLLAGLSFLAKYLQPDFPHATLFTGLLGGGLCVLWGILGRRGTRCRRSAIVTLAAVACVFVRQAVQSWDASATVGSKGPPVAMLMIVLAAFCVGTLASLVQEGRSLIREPSEIQIRARPAAGSRPHKHGERKNIANER
jgi:peptidoglycan/LPS O-acetylase OafA/YrhL